MTDNFQQIAEEQYLAVMAAREQLVRAFVAETGLRPTEAVIVEFRDLAAGAIRVLVESRTEDDKARALAAVTDAALNERLAAERERVIAAAMRIFGGCALAEMSSADFAAVLRNDLAVQHPAPADVANGAKAPAE